MLGGRICTIIKSLFGPFKTLIHEGKLYFMLSFIIGYNYMKYKTTNNKYKLSFMLKANIIDTLDEKFIRQNFIFRSFADILFVN